MGPRLVPRLVARGHQVTATTTVPDKLGLLEQLRPLLFAIGYSLGGGPLDRLRGHLQELLPVRLSRPRRPPRW